MSVDENALDAGDVAAILQVSRSTVYNLVKAGLLTSYSVGRKMRFTARDVEAYIAHARNAASESIAAQPNVVSQTMPDPVPVSPHSPGSGPFFISGNDIAADVIASYLGQAGANPQRRYVNSYNALIDLYAGRAQAAVTHLYDGATKRYNTPYVRRIVPGVPLVVIHLVRRKQGLLVSKRSGKSIRNWGDLLDDGVRIANRERGAGSRVLLDEQLAALEVGLIRPEGYDREFTSPLAAAAFVASGGADVAIGSERIFHQVEGLIFYPLVVESLDIVLLKTRETEQIVRFTKNLLNSKSFREELSHTVGYDTSHTGSILLEI
ncbi:MAG: helix-turn-helix transcriptional regulator [Coriobacteriia bacterium]|nr:helix-turn-helix transcriptional regulator [Coriobacteriia bacterium]